jgi:exopolysaccharide production protein ExoQ
MNAPGKLEKGLAIVLLLLSTGAFLNLFLKHGKFRFDANAGMPFMEVIWAGLYLFVLFFLIKEARGFWRLLLRGWPFLLLLAICLLSIGWSDAKGLTARRSLALVATTVTGVYLAIRYSFKEQLKLLMTLAKISIVLSLIFGALHLGTPVDNLGRGMYGLFLEQNSVLRIVYDVLPVQELFEVWSEPWYGIFTQRNSLGIMMALSIVALLLWSRLEPEEKWSAYPWAGLSLLLLFLSGSLTGLLTLFGVLVVAWLLRYMRRNPARARRIVVASVSVTAIALYFVVYHFATVADFFGRDVTLTGRTTIWGASLILGMDHPWIGHGFNAFWLGDEGPSGEIRKLAGWDVPSAHNGYLEIWLDLGICGLAAFFLGFARHFWKALGCFAREGQWEAAWPLLFLIFLFFVNLAQSALLSPNYVLWILYVAISCRVCLVTARPSEEGAR